MAAPPRMSARGLVKVDPGRKRFTVVASCTISELYADLVDTFDDRAKMAYSEQPVSAWPVDPDTPISAWCPDSDMPIRAWPGGSCTTFHLNPGWTMCGTVDGNVIHPPTIPDPWRVQRRLVL